KRLVLDRKSLWTGIQGHALSGPWAAAFNLPQPYGILIQKVSATSPLKPLGFRGGSISIAPPDGKPFLIRGDGLLATNGVAIDSPAAMKKAHDLLDQAPSGSPISAKVLRAGKIVELKGTKP